MPWWREWRLRAVGACTVLPVHSVTRAQCYQVASSLLEVCVARCSRKGDHVANVFHARDELQGSFQT